MPVLHSVQVQGFCHITVGVVPLPLVTRQQLQWVHMVLCQVAQSRADVSTQRLLHVTWGRELGSGIELGSACLRLPSPAPEHPFPPPCCSPVPHGPLHQLELGLAQRTFPLLPWRLDAASMGWHTFIRQPFLWGGTNMLCGMSVILPSWHKRLEPAQCNLRIVPLMSSPQSKVEV